jgi:amino acid transporter
MILTGSRVYATLGADYPIFARLAAWNRRTAVPVVSIGAQAVAAVLLILSVGTATGRALVDATLAAIGAPRLPWDKYFGGFETLLAGSAPIFWTFFLLTGVAVFLLRRRQSSDCRPFSIPLYPLPPLVLCGTCLYMLYSSVVYARWLVLVVAIPLAFGGGLWLVIRDGPVDNRTSVSGAWPNRSRKI